MSSATETPELSTPENSQEQRKEELFCTPVKIQNRRLNELKNEGAKSPALKVPESPFMKRLGYGTGVGVYLFERSPRANGAIKSPWAIKKIMKVKHGKDKLYAERLEYEASILKQLSHPNIVGYRGFCKPSNNGNAFLAMEKGSTSLANLIEKRHAGMETQDITVNPFPAKDIHKVALNISTALDYLHEKKKILHGDVKSANILIFQNFELVKLCDFGVARRIKEDGAIDGSYVGTEIWNPMEVAVEQSGIVKPITSKADIYPYGLTLFEMISLKPPHLLDAEENRTSETETGDSFDDSAFEEALQERIGTRPSLPDVEFDDSYNTVLEIFYCCTEEDPGKRPTARHIVQLLTACGTSREPT